VSKEEREIVSESYRRRVRLMNRLLAPFDVLELLVIVGGVIGVIVLVLKR
jgi:hypothetical protein